MMVSFKVIAAFSSILAITNADRVSPREIITAIRNGEPKAKWLLTNATTDRNSARNLTHWTNCDIKDLTYPLMGELVCRDNRCLVKCDPGYFPSARNMQAFCRHSKRKGHFWNRNLPDCVTCTPKMIPESSNMSSMCITHGKLNRNTCTLNCKDDSVLAGQTAVTATCKCSLGNCGWTHKTGVNKNEQVDLNNLVCAEPEIAPEIQRNCLRIKTAQEPSTASGSLGFTVKFDDGTIDVNPQKHRKLDFNKRICYPKPISAIDVQNTNANDWIGSFQVEHYDLACTSGCVTPYRETISYNVMIDGNDDSVGQYGTECINGEICRFSINRDEKCPNKSPVCFDVTPSSSVMNTWTCRDCFRIRINYKFSGYKIENWDHRDSLLIKMASPVFWIKAAHPVLQENDTLGIDHIGGNVYKVTFSKFAMFGNREMDFTAELRPVDGGNTAIQWVRSCPCSYNIESV